MARERATWQMQQNRVRQREEEARRLKTYTRETQNIATMAKFDVNSRHRVLLPTALNEQHDLCEVRKASELEIEREVRKKDNEQRSKIEAYLQKQQDDEYRDQMYRQMIRQNSEELRELESKLRDAYRAKENLAQIAEKRAQKFDELVTEAKYGRALEDDVIRFEEEESERQRASQQQKRNYTAQLDKQMNEQAEKRLKACEDFLREKMAIDEIVRRIHEEDEAQAELRLQRKRAHQVEIEEFRKQQQLWRQQEEKRIRQENEHIIAEMAEQESRVDVISKDRKQRQAQLEAIQTKLRVLIEHKEAERMQMEQLRQELSQEQAAVRALKADEQNDESKLRQRLDLQNAHKQSIAQQAKRQAAMREEEEAYTQQLLAQLAERDRIEQLSAEKRRLKALEHRREIQSLIEKKRKELERCRLLEEAEHASRQRREDNRRRIVEEERIRLLREHAKPLLGYLPKGLFKSDVELDQMDREIQDEVTKARVARSSGFNGGVF